MKMLGGDWSRGDLLALIGILVAILGIWIAHRDTTTSEQQQPGQIHESSGGAHGQATPEPATTVIPRSADVSSGQVNFGCEETQPVRTPEVFFGANPRNIQPRTEWVQTDNVKGHNQEVIYDKDPANHVKGVFAQGSITGLDKQLFNCPGGGHGTLVLHVTWTEEQTSTGSNQRSPREAWFPLSACVTSSPIPSESPISLTTMNEQKPLTGIGRSSSIR